MKRFYKVVTIEKKPGGFEIYLDGKPVKTPNKKTLLIPHEKLAQAIMCEWAEQGDDIVPDLMPLTQIMTTCIDRVREHRVEMKKTAMAYLDTDLLCYRAEPPAAVSTAQAEVWDPYLKWFEKEFGVALLVTCDLNALTQPDEARRAASAYVDSLDDVMFTVFQLIVSLSGSLILGLAFVKGHADPEAVFNAAHVEEQYKAAIYDEEKHGAAPQEEQKRAVMLRDLAAAQAFLT